MRILLVILLVKYVVVFFHYRLQVCITQHDLPITIFVARVIVYDMMILEEKADATFEASLLFI